MSTVTPSTEEPEVEKTPDIWPPWRLRPPFYRLGRNELASTAREWALKPPPGMESEPLTRESIRRAAVVVGLCELGGLVFGDEDEEAGQDQQCRRGGY
jgi:hypothetical protein